MSDEIIFIDEKKRDTSPDLLEIAALPKRTRKRRTEPIFLSDEIQFIKETKRTRHDTGVEFISSRPVWPQVTHRDRIMEQLSSMYASSVEPNRSKAISNIPKIVPPAEPEVAIQPAMLKCTVCLELASETTPLCSTVCGHIFCKDCLEAALKVDKKCPNCRKKLSKNQYHRLYLSV